MTVNGRTFGIGRRDQKIMKGFINLYKPCGVSSAFAVGAVKRKFNTPCGHMGTLDPMASGILPVGVGKASRLFQFITEKKKTYRARFKFGVSTDTLDVTGTVEKTTDIIPTEEEIKAALLSFTGEIMQRPPKYSAKSVGGRRGYELARKGVDFDLPEKKVSVFRYEFLGKTEDCGENEYAFEIDCGGGTYIRSLARDLGEKLGSLAVMSALERTASGIFTKENSVTLEEFKNSDDPEKFLIKPELTVNFPEIILSDREATRILNGIFDYRVEKDGLYKVFNEKEFLGVGEAANGILRIKAYVR